MDLAGGNRQASLVSTTALSRGSAFSRDDAVVFGVASALAQSLRLDVTSLRLAMIGGALASPPLGGCYLAGALLAVPIRRRGPNRRFTGVDPRNVAGLLGLLLAELAVVLIARALGLTLPDPIVGLVLAVQAILGLSWRRLEASERWSWLTGVAQGRSVNVAGRRISAGVLRLGFGVTLVLAATYLLSRRSIAWPSIRSSLGDLWPLVLMVLGIGIVLLPPLLRVSSQFSIERRERIRADERARLAAHLHDSVLQTLTLIQRHGDDPTNMATLARKQERELRDWLYGAVASEDAGRLRDRLTALSAEIEDRYKWRVELIVVGDADVGTSQEALLAATREAMVNAARHSSAASCDVFAECLDDAIQVFVRDRGRGFDTTSVPGDRRGLTDSIVARMERAGGVARVRSTPTSGTEVFLELPARVVNH